MKLFKRMLSIILIVNIMLSIVAFMPLNSSASTGISIKIDALRSKFPEGKYWNHYANSNHNNYGFNGSCTSVYCNNPDGYTSSPCTSHNSIVGVGGYDCNNFDGGIQCFGFANKVFYDIFGVYASQTEQRTDIYNVSIGDWVRINNDTHSAVVIGRSADTITVVECNLSLSGVAYNCRIRWGATYSISSINYFKHASNYDVVNNSVYPSQPTLSIYSGDSSEDVMFMSSEAQNATQYDFRIYNATTNELIAYFPNSPRVVAMNLPAGEYYANVIGVNSALTNTDRWWGTYSENVNFTVSEGVLTPANTIIFEGRKYEVYLGRLTWENAKTKCEELGGHLATITSNAEQLAVEELANDSYVYLGGKLENGNWTWITGEEFSYTHWLSNQPDNNGWVSEDYIGLYTDMYWNDYDFINSNIEGFICEYECAHVEFTEEIIEATCTEEGCIKKKCVNCDYEEIVILEKTDHNKDWKITPSTCTSEGVQNRYCVTCGLEFPEENVIIEATGHNMKIVDHAFPKCSEYGYLIESCEVCGYTETTWYEPTSPRGCTWSFDKQTPPSCTKEGVTYLYCINCGDTKEEIIPATGHIWSEWITMKEPTYTTGGERMRYCTVCKTPETELIPVLEQIVPELSTNNYTIMLSEADSISHIRYASGIYETASDIKNATDCVNLDSSIIAKNTVDGLLNYELSEGGIYSLWVKMSDGTTYIMTADLTVMEQEVEAYGVTVTVKNLYGVKDFFIAKGDHDNYSDVKANYIFNVTSAKIAGAHNYKYILSEPGTYTVCVRYDDATRAHKFITFEAKVVEPKFTENGLQLTVENLDDVKVIRTAYGEYTTPGKIKKSEGARAFTAKTIANSGENYTIQYRENGLVTVAVVYNNGYEVMYSYEVQKKTPNFVTSGNSVIIGNLDGLNLVRYAKGEYITSNQIKNAAGSKVLKSDSIVGGYIILELDLGTYTFCVQYDDESYNYYTVTVN